MADQYEGKSMVEVFCADQIKNSDIKDEIDDHLKNFQEKFNTLQE